MCNLLGLQQPVYPFPLSVLIERKFIGSFHVTYYVDIESIDARKRATHTCMRIPSRSVSISSNIRSQHPKIHPLHRIDHRAGIRNEGWMWCNGDARGATMAHVRRSKTARHNWRAVALRKLPAAHVMHKRCYCHSSELCAPLSCWSWCVLAICQKLSSSVRLCFLASYYVSFVVVVQFHPRFASILGTY